MARGGSRGACRGVSSVPSSGGFGTVGVLVSAVEQVLDLRRQRDLRLRDVALAGQRRRLGLAAAAPAAEAALVVGVGASRRRRRPRPRAPRACRGPCRCGSGSSGPRPCRAPAPRCTAGTGPTPVEQQLDQLARSGCSGSAEQSSAQDDDAQEVADLVEAVDPERLPVDVVEERLHAGEALALLARRSCPAPAGRAARASGSSSTERSRSSIVWRNWRSGLREARRVLGQLAQLGDLLGGLARAPSGRRRPPRPSARVEPRERVRERLQGRRAGGRSPAPRRACGAGTGSARSAVASSCASVGRSSPRKRRQLVPLRLEAVGARRLDLGRLHRLLRPARELLALGLDRRADLVGVRDEVADRLGSGGRGSRASR